MKKTKEKRINGNGVIQTPFYYGWVIVILAGLSHFFSGPGQTYSNAIFIDYYIEEFGWSRSTVSGIYSSATLLAGFLLFIIGRMIDKVGARKMAIAVSLILAAASIFNSFVINWVMLFMGFFAIRLFGQGSMTLVPNALVPQWFIQKRGRALGLAALGGMIGSAAFPLINVWLIEAYGWRTTWQILGASIVLFFTPLAFFFIRNQPEDIGLLPDNGPLVRDEDQQKPLSSDSSWTVKEAKKTRSFWLLLFCVVVPALVNTGMTFHLVSIFSIQSLAPETAATVLSLMAIIGFPVTFLAGYLLDKIRVQWMLAFVFVGEIASIFLLKEADLFSGAILFAVVWGFMLGIERVTLSVVWPNYFGRQYLGSITGISMAFMVIGSALGPLPFGLFYDFFGGYKEVLWAIMIFPLLGIVAALLANPPEKEGIEN
ncbi:MULTISPECIES: MFS transporter [Planococcus]|uniref:MFS transporter n=1 Tax=Planococcus faecalis TaxID=1598147 RepID=A0ABN4XLS8_9BACL|nr:MULTISPECIES: MFS transporter [Planococcus]AQU78902.1 MFS transporter [Planococcus faecalis]MDJ0330841.1 MFS transporter [Planococcus sp. S3-L1]